MIGLAEGLLMNTEEVCFISNFHKCTLGYTLKQCPRCYASSDSQVFTLCHRWERKTERNFCYLIRWTAHYSFFKFRPLKLLRLTEACYDPSQWLKVLQPNLSSKEVSSVEKLKVLSCVPQPSDEEEVVAVLLKKICSLFGIKYAAAPETSAPAADGSLSARLKWIWTSVSVRFPVGGTSRLLEFEPVEH